MDILSTIKRSLKGERHDYTVGSISQAVILLAVPMMLELGLESVFAIVDMFFVSRLGQNAIATVGLTESVVTLIYSVAIGLSVGATAIVARRIGEKNPEEASHAGAQVLNLAIVVSLVLGLLGGIFAPDILGFMGASPEVIRTGTPFSRIMFGASTVIVFLFLNNGIFRGAGDASMAMKSLWIASGINIILCPVFIRIFGLEGAAMATVVGRGTGVAYQCYHLFKGDGVIKLLKRHFHLDIPLIRTSVSLAWPASLQYIAGSGSWIILTRLVAQTGGTAASAGYQIAFRNFVFFILPAWGLSNAAATLVGQNLGAKHTDRAEESVVTTAKYSLTLMFFVTVFFVTFAPNLINVFTESPDVKKYGIEALRIIGSGFILYGVGMVLIQALNGAGDTRTPTLINFFSFWIFQTPLAFFLARVVHAGTKGAVVAIPMAHGVLASMAWVYFKKGKWKTTQI